MRRASRRTRRLCGLAVTALTAASSLTACRSAAIGAGTDAHTSGDIVIRATVPKSGPISSYGVIAGGLKAYFDSVNADGGIHGRKINFSSLDDGYQPAQSLNNVRRFVQRDHADVVVGFGAITASDRDFVQAEKVPMVAINGSAPFNYTPTYSYIRTSLPDQRIDVIASAQYTAKQFPQARVGLLSINSDVASTIIDGLHRGLGHTAQLVDTELYPSSTTELTAYVDKMRSKHVTDVYINGAAPVLASTVRYIRQIGWQPRLYVFQNNSSIASAMSVAGAAADGAYSSFYFKDPADTRWKNDADMTQYRGLVTKYAPGTDPKSLFTLMGFTTGEAIVDALRRADTSSPTDFLNAWDHIDTKALIGYLPGVVVKYDPVDGRLYHSEQIVQYDNSSWKSVGDLITVPGIPATFGGAK